MESLQMDYQCRRIIDIREVRQDRTQYSRCREENSHFKELS